MPFRSAAVGPVCAGTLLVALAVQPAQAADCADQARWDAPRATAGAAADTVRVCNARSDGVGFFLLRYHQGHATPLWAAYHLSRSKMLAVDALDLPADDGYFAVDAEIDVGGFESPRNDDYTGVGDRGLARGHLAPAEAMSWDPEAREETYRVSNIAPQHARFNGGAWAMLEGNVRAWACDLGTLNVVTGVIHGAGAQPPLDWDDGTDIDVPTHFYKVVWTPANGGQAVGFLLPNPVPVTADDAADAARNPIPATAEALHAHIRAIDRIEAAAGWDFMPGLPPALAEQLEAQPADPGDWPLTADSRFDCTREYLAERVE
jgi:DNA/RNA endonuclease G (NUC1)